MTMASLYISTCLCKQYISLYVPHFFNCNSTCGVCTAEHVSIACGAPDSGSARYNADRKAKTVQARIEANLTSQGVSSSGSGLSIFSREPNRKNSVFIGNMNWVCRQSLVHSHVGCGLVSCTCYHVYVAWLSDWSVVCHVYTSVWAIDWECIYTSCIYVHLGYLIRCVCITCCGVTCTNAHVCYFCPYTVHVQSMTLYITCVWLYMYYVLFYTPHVHVCNVIILCSLLYRRYTSTVWGIGELHSYSTIHNMLPI